MNRTLCNATWPLSPRMVHVTSGSIAMILCAAAAAQSPEVIRVGLRGQVATVAEAAKLARDGSVIEIEAGDYRGDVAVWTQNDLTIRGVGGRPKLIASGFAAERKAIWVLRGGNVTVEDIEFHRAKVPDKNGAGIRLERGTLTVRRCAFFDNENGILTRDDKALTVTIEDSEFARNGAGDGLSHGVYIGGISKLTVRGSYFHSGKVGHLIKSRAQENYVLYNRLTDDIGGTSSYEIEFPHGGLAVVIGNLIQQSALTENPALISFGAEGYKWPRNELYLSHNTLVNDRAENGFFVQVAPGAGTARVVNNVLVGVGTELTPPQVTASGNVRLEWDQFVLPPRLDYRLRLKSKVAGTASDPGSVGGIQLRPTHEITIPIGASPVNPASPLSPGAFQKLVN